MKLHIGCGRDIREGYINLDKAELNGVDVAHDLDVFPYPFSDNYFDEILCRHVLFCLNNLIKVYEELYRITKNKGIIKITEPIFPSFIAMTDPTQKHCFTYGSWNYFQHKGGLDYYSEAHFNILNRKIVFHSYLKLFELIFNSNEFMKKLHYGFLSFLIPALEINVELEVVK